MTALRPFGATVRRVFPDDPGTDRTGIRSTLRRPPLSLPTVSCRLSGATFVSRASIKTYEIVLQYTPFSEPVKYKKVFFAGKSKKLCVAPQKMGERGVRFVRSGRRSDGADCDGEQAAEQRKPAQPCHALACKQRQGGDSRAACVKNIECTERLARLHGRVDGVRQRNGLRQPVCAAFFKQQRVFIR